VTAPAFLSPPGRPTAVTEPDEVDALAGWILDVARRRPLVVLTARDGENEPALAARSVQGLVGDDGDVVAIAQVGRGRLTRALARALPVGLMVFGGAARIYWPTGDVGTDPDRHPLIRADVDGMSIAKRQTRLGELWRRGPDNQDAGAGTGAGEELPIAITRAWLATVPDTERPHFPLRPYTVAPDLTAQLEVLEPAREPVAELAAQIISGRVWTQPGPGPERLHDDGQPRIRDQDHAVAWRLAIPGSDRYLYYWHPATGSIDLARIGTGDPTTPPPAPAPAAAPEPVVKHQAPATARRAAKKPKAAQPRRREPAPLATDEALLRVLREAGQPLAVAEIRDALNIDPKTSRDRVGSFLKDVTDRGIVTRTGQTRGTRYAAP